MRAIGRASSGRERPRERATERAVAALRASTARIACDRVSRGSRSAGRAGGPAFQGSRAQNVGFARRLAGSSYFTTHPCLEGAITSHGSRTKHEYNLFRRDRSWDWGSVHACRLGAVSRAERRQASGRDPRHLVGPITIELDQEKAPITVENFLKYVDDGFYDNLIFHRVIPRFMIQGGGFDAKLREKAKGSTGRSRTNRATA